MQLFTKYLLVWVPNLSTQENDYFKITMKFNGDEILLFHSN